MYQILIRDKKNPSMYSFLNVKQQIMKETVEKVEDDDGNLVDKITKIPTGNYETVVYSEEDQDEFEKKCVELLKTYNLDELKFINTLEYDTDIIWK